MSRKKGRKVESGRIVRRTKSGAVPTGEVATLKDGVGLVLALDGKVTGIAIRCKGGIAIISPGRAMEAAARF